MERKTLSLCGKVKLRGLSDLDGRTTAAKAAFSLRDAIAADLGGVERLSAMQGAIVNAAALIGAMIEHLGAQYLAGAEIDRLEFASLANAQRRLFSDLGLQQIPPADITPLKEYLRRKA